MWNQGELYFDTVVFIKQPYGLGVAVLFRSTLAWLQTSLLLCVECKWRWVKWRSCLINDFNDTVVYLFIHFQEGTVSPVWLGATLSLQEDLHHLPYPRGERKRGSVLISTLKSRNNSLKTWHRNKSVKIVLKTSNTIPSFAKWDIPSLYTCWLLYSDGSTKWQVSAARQLTHLCLGVCLCREHVPTK